MNIERAIKGRVTESLAFMLFDRAGYRIARFGIEELFREVKIISKEDYRNLGLDERLRALPDFLVSNAATTEAFQVEVKFRKSFCPDSRRELFETINYQRGFWSNTFHLIFLGKSPRLGARFYQDYIRVITPDCLIDDFCDFNVSDFDLWESLCRLNHAFNEFSGGDFEIDFIVPILRQLNDTFEN